MTDKGKIDSAEAMARAAEAYISAAAALHDAEGGQAIGEIEGALQEANAALAQLQASIRAFREPRASLDYLTYRGIPFAVADAGAGTGDRRDLGTPRPNIIDELRDPKGWPPARLLRPDSHGIALADLLRRAKLPLSEDEIVGACKRVEDIATPIVAEGTRLAITNFGMQALHAQLRNDLRFLFRDGILPFSIEPVFRMVGQYLEVSWRKQQ